jgi:hypothetical protein
MTERDGKKKLKWNVAPLQKLPQRVGLLFLLWPFAAFIYALRNFRSPWASKIFMLFASFFGFTFVRYGDATRVAAQLKDMQGLSLGDVFFDYFVADSGKLDIVYSLITWLVSVFTNDYRFLFAILTFLFAFFITKAVWFLIQRAGGHIGRLDGLMLIAFALTVQVWYIGGRWNLAALIFCYCLLLYFYKDNRKYLWLSFLSVFIHWTFFLVVPLALLYLLLKNRSLIYYVFFVISFFYVLVNTQTAQTAFEDFAPDPVLESRSGYFNEDVIDSTKTHMDMANWYVTGHREAINWFVFVAASFIFLRRLNQIRKNKPLFNLFHFAMLFLGVANALSSIQNMERFFTVGHWLFLAVFFLYVHQVKGRFHPAVRTFSMVALLIFIIVRIRVAMDFISIWTLFGNPIFAYFVENKIAIIQIIKTIIPL